MRKADKVKKLLNSYWSGTDILEYQENRAGIIFSIKGYDDEINVPCKGGLYDISYLIAHKLQSLGYTDKNVVRHLDFEKNEIAEQQRSSNELYHAINSMFNADISGDNTVEPLLIRSSEHLTPEEEAELVHEINTKGNLNSWSKYYLKRNAIKAQYPDLYESLEQVREHQEKVRRFASKIMSKHLA